MTIYILLILAAVGTGMAISVYAFGTGGKRKRIFQDIYFSVEDNEGVGVVYTKNGEYAAILRMENPVDKYSADIDGYYEYTRLFTAIAQTLGEGYALHKQDIFVRKPFCDESESKREYLSESYFHYFNGREYTDSQTYLTVTQEAQKSRLFSFDGRKWRDFLVKIRKVQDQLKDAGVRAEFLTKEDASEYIDRYFAMDFTHKTLSMNNFKVDEECVRMGDRKCKIFSLVDVDSINLPSLVRPFANIEVNNTQMPVDVMAAIDQIPEARTVVYNQMIFIPNQKRELALLEKKKNRHASIPNPGNQMAVEDIKQVQEVMAREGKQLVYTHYNLVVCCDSDADLQKPTNHLENTFGRMGVHISKRAYNQLELFVNSFPGNCYGMSAEYDRFLTLGDAAACLMYKEKIQHSEDTPLKIYYTDRQGVPVAIDITGKEGKHKLTDNSNFFCLGPSGSGKSFHMDNDMSESVIDIFIDLYKKGVIYRGVRMVNWDSKAQTALSDEEVIYKETESTLYYIRYLIEGSNQFLEIATSRPETLLGDSAVCVNPNDQRYIHLRNKYVITPIIGRKIPIIFDDYVDSEFGSGVLKITPAHDINDYCIGLKYNLDIINILNNDGTVNELGGKFQGQDRFECRANILKELRELGLLVKEVPYINNIGYSERTNSIIEPKLSTQWFCKMNELAKPAINVVTNNQIKFYPDKYKNIYLHWMNNIKDWCISRQLWWGQRIPAYYIDNGEYVVAKDIEEAYIIFKQKYPDLSITDLKQDEDVLDTWFSSWLWPISSFGGIHDKNNEELKYYYPINVLVTAPDIIFFWVARMIMFGLYWKNEIPFEKVCFTGLVRDKSKRKMSKSLGNSPDPIDLINKYGADGVRVGMLLCAPAGTDIIFDEQQCLQGRNFVNKLWNAYKLINSWTVDNNLQQPTYSQQAIEWFTNLISYTQLEIEHNIENCRVSDALHNVYELIWDNFCPYYLEIIKPVDSKKIDKTTMESTNIIFSAILKFAHLFIPFVTEEIWARMKYNSSGLLATSKWDCNPIYDKYIIDQSEQLKCIISKIRKFRTDYKISHKESLKLIIRSNQRTFKIDIIKKMCNLSLVEYTDELVENSYSFIEYSSEFFITGYINRQNENLLDNIIDRIEYFKGFISKIEEKLKNDSFINKAPESIIKREKQKLEDSKSQLLLLQEKMRTITNE